MNIILWVTQTLLALAFLAHGLMFVMIVTISATGLHLWRAEYGAAATTVVLLLMAAFVAYGRARTRPITPRWTPARAV
jgi:hypothetical protein